MAVRIKSLEEQHGKINNYHLGCRCVLCKAANNKASKDGRARRAAKKEIPHGTEAAYVNYSCRCDLCTAAHATYARELRASKREHETVV